MEASSHLAARVPPPGLTRGRTPRTVGERVIKALLFLAALLSVLTTVGIIFSLLSETLSFFREVPIFDYLTGTVWRPTAGGDAKSFGVLPLVWSTLYLTGIALLVGIPLGLAAAVYLSEYARPGVRRVIKPVLEVLAGVPTIVFGYFALTFVTPTVLRALGIDVEIFNGLSAGLVLGILGLPIIASVAEDALSAVPGSLREGAFGLGASKLQVTLRVVFPAALSGVMAGLVLCASRLVGETVVILVAAGSTPNLGLDLRESFQSMAAFIAQQSRGDIPTGSIEYRAIFAVGTTLFLMTLVLNAISIRFVRRFRQVYD